MKILSLKDDRGFVTLTLNRPERRNALNKSIMADLKTVLEMYQNDDAVRCLILTGSGPSFCVGADVEEMYHYTPADIEQDPLAEWSLLAHFKKPIIAAVFGHVLGGGLEIALMCDIVICSEKTVFGQPEIHLGIMPGLGGTQRLPSLVGKSRAMEMCLTGRFISDKEAQMWGLVAKIVPHEKLLDEAQAIAQDISQKSLSALIAIKACIQGAFGVSAQQEEGLRRERQSFYSLFGTKEQKEKMRSFLEKKAGKDG